MTLINWAWCFMAFYIGLMLFIGYIASKRIAHADDFATGRGS